MPLSQRLHLFRRQRNLLAQTTCPGFGNQIVLFVTDAAEIPVFFHFIIVDEIRELLLPFPKVYQFGDEVYARLHRVYKARLEGDGKT